ncbi:hypothetical protein Y032_0330g2688 [Ancylostoma ceylanicum]|uniref:Uncharacterized protein n=1 Tax=Ancylostoma ceylanicum TaxID=53326 RepID=A0A016RZ99_9BILA|nr:hypothetical protein Y032_0330g2688 [Ancylostoma ceylanicum]
MIPCYKVEESFFELYFCGEFRMLIGTSITSRRAKRERSISPAAELVGASQQAAGGIDQWCFRAYFWQLSHWAFRNLSKMKGSDRDFPALQLGIMYTTVISFVSPFF